MENARTKWSINLFLTITVVASFAVFGLLLWAGMREEAEPPNHYEEVSRARKLLERGEFEQAFQIASQIRDEKPGAAEALTVAAHALLATGQVSTAKQALERSLHLKSDQADACKMLAAIYIASGDGPRGVTMLQRAAELDPRDFRPWFAMGKVRHEMGDLAESAEAYAAALARVIPAEEAKQARLGRIRVLLDANRDDEATPDLEMALKSWGDSAEVLGLAARRARALGETEEALQFAERALAIDSKNFDSYLVRGQVRQLAGQLEEALADLERAAELNPNHQGALQLMLQVQTRLGRGDDAERTKQRVQALRDRLALMNRLAKEINQRPNDPEPRYLMGKAALEGGLSTLAYQCFQAALDLQPDYEPAREGLTALRESGFDPRQGGTEPAGGISGTARIR